MINRLLNPWRLRVYPWAALGTLTVCFLLILVASPDLITPQGVPLGGDYLVFYGVGSLVGAGNYASVFEVSAVNQAQKDALNKPDLNHFHAWVYPPYTALPLALLARLPYLPSFLLFTALMAVCSWYAVALIGRISPFIAHNRGPVFAATLSFYPLFRAVAGGQNTALSLLLICGATAMAVQRRDGLAGVCLGLLMFKPHFALPLIGLALLARRGKIVAVSISVAVACGLAAVPFFGWEWPRRWLISVVRYRQLEGDVNGPNLVSLLGVSEQLLGSGNTLAWAAAALTGIPLILWLCWLFWSKVARDQLVAESWAVAAAALVLLSPHSQFYELGLLALPMMLLAARQSWNAAGAILLIWLAAWTHALFHRPLVQPLFFLAVLGFFASLKLLRAPGTPTALPVAAD
ncbi:MAG: DUF2029 domain-containing protein [Planctomycetales bacterium]|nr:DUF2029 domain-containing protein [Planctomycetales bacterium]NIM07784.1 DUF2029 domain-containing protein [Planctomycetales bacterium]NIN07278.1 DUF2029 domain-containing protein [Planctomycetales bacterium]NIN76370.1 DUF2029 domain-containing protein [Planctomycetales bacterium]NIO33579.1 DUF2029 domain-containing protein [Planctomycetales bacterium]